MPKRILSIDDSRRALNFIAKPFTGDTLVAGLAPYIDLGRKAAPR
jgi:hypothetical protein